MKVEVAVTTLSRLPNGFATVAVRVPAAGVADVVDFDFETLEEAFGVPDQVAVDLVVVAGIVYVLDKAVLRANMADAWTRTFDVAFPVSDAARWEAVRPELERCLRFLTGDVWRVAFTPRSGGIFLRQRRRRRGRIRADAVSLFSGGLDSLTGVIDRLVGTDDRLALIGHHDATTTAGDQKRTYLRLRALRPAFRPRTSLHHIRVRPLPPAFARSRQQVTKRPHEDTLRSRSLVFLALGLYAARALGPDEPLLAPENGFIAVNVPLTPSRIGTCSTRTAHPAFVEAVRAIASGLGVTNPILNPLAGGTKGEVLARCRDADLLGQLVPETVSCAHASRRMGWARRGARNCGYCVPCLVRRAALHHLGKDDGQAYGFDVATGELDLSAAIAGDVRALLAFLRRVRGSADVAALVRNTGSFPPGAYESAVGVAERGVRELRTWASASGLTRVPVRR